MVGCVSEGPKQERQRFFPGCWSLPSVGCALATAVCGKSWASLKSSLARGKVSLWAVKRSADVRYLTPVKHTSKDISCLPFSIHVLVVYLFSTCWFAAIPFAGRGVPASTKCNVACVHTSVPVTFWVLTFFPVVLLCSGMCPACSCPPTGAVNALLLSPRSAVLPLN